MKRIDYITLVLATIGHAKVGLLESATLLCIASGYASKQSIIKRTGQHPESLTARIRHLRGKGLIKSIWTSEGTQSHSLTSKGIDLVAEILNPKTPTK
jgi:DNA-binding PadR family transcriptional regulator